MLRSQNNVSFVNYLFQYILVDERNSEHMESHIRMDVVLRVDALRSLPIKHSRTNGGQNNRISFTDLFSGKI